MKYTLVRLFLVNSLLALAISSYCQTEFETNSGSIIEYNNDGSWEYVIAETDEEINPFEEPERISGELNNRDLLFVKGLIGKYKDLEANEAVKMLMAEKKVSLQEVQVSYYRSLKNDQESDSAKKKLKQYEKEVDDYIDLYKSFGDTISMLRDFREKGSSDNDSFLKKFGRGTSEENVNSRAVMNGEIRRNSWPEFNPDVRKSYNVENQCKIQFNGKNAGGKGELIEHQDQILFYYTSPKIKPYYKEKHYLVANSRIEKVDGSYFVVLALQFRSKDAGKSYGYVNRGEGLFLKYIDNTQSILKSVINSTPKLEEYSGNTLYELVYEIDKDARNRMKKSYLDKVGIMYSTGYEEYDIYNVDILMNQLKCIEKAD